MMADTLLVYYSLTGMNDAIAAQVQQMGDIDGFKISSQYDYPTGMYDCWDVVRKFRHVNTTIPRHGEPLPDIKQLPPIQNNLPDITNYQNIIIGGPVWGWTMADPIMTYLNESNLAGKNVKAYCTCVNTDYNYEHDFKSLLSPDANYQGGLCIDAGISDNPQRHKSALQQLINQ